MKFNGQKGASNLAGILILIFLFIIILTTPRGDIGNFNLGISSAGRTSTEPRSYVYGGSISNSPTSSGTSNISIGSGNASYAYQSYEEYITLENYSGKAINITGYQLKNGKDQRPYNVGGSLQRFSADIALIPQGTLKLLPNGNSLMQDIVLQDGERAIVTTGKVGNGQSNTIVSFKENSCSGYLDASPDYTFFPPLTRSCPRPANEPGIQNLDVACRKVVENLPPCQTPKLGGKDESGQNCPDCINGKLLSSFCSAFIKEHFSYQGCLLNHGNDRDFLGKNWRIFLGRGWEMWAKDYESIELFDRFGQLVNFQNY
jgi:hypothetical protein